MSDSYNQSRPHSIDRIKLVEFKTSKASSYVIEVIGFPVAASSFDAQLKIILEWASSRESKVVFVANVHMLMEAYWHPDFSFILKSADLVTPDGMPLVWMMRLMGAREQNRVSGMDLLLSLCKLTPLQNISIFFLGSESKILETIRIKLEHEFPNVKIAGMEPLPFRPLTPAEDKAIIQKIHESGTQLVLVSLGCPKQEYWMHQHKGKIQAVMIGLGGALPVFAGFQKRAPLWMRNSGLEWFYRLIQEPRRLWSRYMNTIPPFIWLALLQLINLKLKANSSRRNS